MPRETDSGSNGQSNGIFASPWVSIALKYAPQAANYVKTYFLRSKNVLLVGHTGVGKTAVLDEILRPTLNALPKETPTIKPDEVKVDIGGAKVLAVDTPGHPIPFQEFAEHELERLIAGDFQGIIIVVAYGYSQPRGSVYESDRSEIAPVIDGEINNEFVILQREAEFEFLEQWVSQIEKFPKSSEKVKWVVIALNKFEMLERDGIVDEAKAYYSLNGKFGERLRTIVDERSIFLHTIAADPGNFYDIAIDVSSSRQLVQALNDSFRSRLEKLFK